MAETKNHESASGRVYFCRVPKCADNDYAKSCQVPWRSEAHHIVCVAELNRVYNGGTQDVKEILDEGTWCINNPDNMMPLPLWGTTIMHYCSKFSGITNLSKLTEALKGNLLKSEQAPPTFDDQPTFENLPQHNYGHRGRTSAEGYSQEVEEQLRDWITTVQVDKAEHDITGQDVTDGLDGLSQYLRGELNDRGRRKGSDDGGGTHLAWMNGNDTWYVPFSMALEPTKMPAVELLRKVRRVAEVLWKTGK